MATSVELTHSVAAREKDYLPPENANAIGIAVEPTCGDTLTISLKVNIRQFIEAAGFTLTETACDTVRACAVKACELASKKAVLAAYTVTAQEISYALSPDGTPDQEHIHCAQMAELALKRAVLAFAKGYKRD